MNHEIEEIITSAYSYFNARNIDDILSLMSPDVHWPNGWEGGFVKGHDAVRNYWTRQWKEIDPIVIPIELRELPDRRIEVKVHQKISDLNGNRLIDGMVLHIYSIKNNLICSMEIQNV